MPDHRPCRVWAISGSTWPALVLGLLTAVLLILFISYYRGSLEHSVSSLKGADINYFFQKGDLEAGIGGDLPGSG